MGLDGHRFKTFKPVTEPIPAAALRLLQTFACEHGAAFAGDDGGELVHAARASRSNSRFIARYFRLISFSSSVV